MAGAPVSLVDILREFLAAHERLDHIAELHRRGELDFEKLRAFVGDDEYSVLFRLKEKCHALFRPTVDGTRVAPREALFDLAIGSLFHEAMKFREDFYQREVYGPRVNALRAEAEQQADGLFQEFERILSALTPRLEEGLRETRALMEQSWLQLRVLLAERPEDGFVTRYLVERSATIDALGPPGLDALLTEIHGEPATGFLEAGRSHLLSGHYERATELLAQAEKRGASPREVEAQSLYASAMSAYLEGDYERCVSQLADWVAMGDERHDPLTAVAHAALSKIGQLVAVEDRDRLVAAASRVAEKL